MDVLLTIWLPLAITVVVAAFLHRRRPASTVRALRALERVVAPEREPERPHLRLVVDNTRRHDRAA